MRTGSAGTEGEIREANNVSVNMGSGFPLSFWEVTVATTVVLGFVLGLLGVYLTMPPSDYSFLKLPRTLEDLQILRLVIFSFSVNQCLIVSRQNF